MGINNNKQQSFYSVDKSLKKEDKSLKKIVKHRSTSVIAGLSISLLTFTSVEALNIGKAKSQSYICLLYTSPSPRDQRGSRMPSSA